MLKTLAASLTLAVCVVAPAAAMAAAPTKAHVALYRHDRALVVRKDGTRAAGCNLVGPHRSCHTAATDASLLASIGVLQRILAPAPSTPVVAPVTPAATSSSYSVASTQYHPQYTQPAASYSSGGYSIPGYIVQCESGGNYSAVNSSSGAGGAYQIMPSTWAAYGGTGLPQNASKAEQDRIAGEIYATQGSSPWTCAR